MISGSIRWFHITIHIAVSIDETAVTVTSDGKPNINRLVLCASRYFLSDINNLCFDELQNIIINRMCVSYGGTNGLTQAINDHTNN